MISYAQNFEDVILERIFKNINDGFYVDIGACHPVYDSVTKYFYDKGWHGVNVEPIPELISLFEEDRTRDTNLGLAIGATAGSLQMCVTQSLANSTLNPVYKEKYESDDLVTQKLDVSAVSLTEIWTSHVQDKHVHFLKIDVEGFEKEALLGADFNTVDPDILVIEATIPNSSIETHHQWEYLLDGFYTFFYFDGINRFYRRIDFNIDTGKVSVPPNVFDQFMRYGQIKAEKAVEYLLAKNKEITQALESTEQGSHGAPLEAAEVRELQVLIDSLEDKLASAEQQALDEARRVSKYAQQNSQLESALAEAQQKLTDAETQLHNLRENQQALAEAREFIAIKDQYIESLLNALDTKGQQLGNAADVYESLAVAFTHLSRMVKGDALPERESAELRQAQQEAEDKAAELAQAQRDLLYSSDEINAHCIELTEESESTNAEEAFNALQDAYAFIERKDDEINELLALLERKEQDISGQEQYYKQLISDLYENLSAAEYKICEQETRLYELSSEYAFLKQRISAMQSAEENVNSSNNISDKEQSGTDYSKHEK